MGLAPEPVPPCPQQQEFPLTRREHEVTELIAAGLKNRQIGERLFIAQRTVDTYVGHILAKLGRDVRYLGGFFMPGGGRAICNFGAESPADITTVNEWAGAPFTEVLEAIELRPGVRHD